MTYFQVHWGNIEGAIGICHMYTLSGVLVYHTLNHEIVLRDNNGIKYQSQKTTIEGECSVSWNHFTSLQKWVIWDKKGSKITLCLDCWSQGAVPV